MTEKRLLAAIIIAFVIIASVYALTTPVFEASDELWHYPMIRHLADGNSLPQQVFDPQLAGPWKQEASQPPLYYYLGAALTFWLDTSDVDRVRWLNPHVDNGIITTDGNNNLVIHDPAINPWNGTQLAVLIVRFFSVLLGAVTVYLTYRIAKEVAPDRPEISLGASAINAFIPMFLFISGAVNNDNLVIPLASLAVLTMIRYVKYTSVKPRSEYLQLSMLGIVIGLGALTKMTALGLLPLAAFAIFVGRWLRGDGTVTLRTVLRLLWQTGGRLLLVLLPAVLIAGWWYYRNLALYGDWTGWNAFIAVLGQRARPASLAQLWGERWGFMLAYWGLFGGVNVPMSEWIYRVLNGVTVAAFFGFIIYVILLLRDWIRETWSRIDSIRSLAANILNFTVRYFALIICAFWAGAVVVGLIRWATITWSSQGRLVFSAISVLSTLLAVGLVGWMPKRPARVVISILTAFMIVISIAAPFLWIRPAYRTEVASKKANVRIDNLEFGDSMRLLGYDLDSKLVRPGETVELTIYWQALAEMDRDWSVFVHLNDPVLDAPVAQRDMYPGQGLLATRLLKSGQEIANVYHLKLPETAVAPADLSLTVGLYDVTTGVRMMTSQGNDHAVLTELSLEQISGELPNPISVNFENQMELLGFTIDSRRVQPTDSIDLMLYWRPLHTLTEDYTFFAQVVDDDTTRWASQDLLQPTTLWEEGEVQSVSMQLPLNANTMAGVYPLIVGAYTRLEDGSFDRLQILTDEGQLVEDFLMISYVRVD